MKRSRSILIVVAGTALVILLPDTASAYIGPGAGFALAGSFLAVFGAVLSAISMLLFWPLRRLTKFLLRRRPPKKPRFKRIVILGLDGLDHALTEQYLAEGKLPNLSSLREQGTFRSLRSTLPPISPVAWATFQTGVNPGKHNIFDFLMPDTRTYQPKLSSVEIRESRRRFGWGPIQWSRSKPDVRLLRKSQPFWSVLSRYGIFNSILRVPITFPPERLRGVQLSAMCVPDLRGTQGTFSFYTSERPEVTETTGGEVHHVQRDGDVFRCSLSGPPNPRDTQQRPIKLPFTVRVIDKDTACLKIHGNRYRLVRDQYSDWLQVRFPLGRNNKAVGVCRFLLIAADPEFRMYVTPVNIDPESPAMPIGYPAVYPIYHAKRQGSYATQGLAEDTWGLSEQVLEDRHFLRQCLDIECERESMFFDSLAKVPEGLCVCVFDGSDRTQHMFWRYQDAQHPAHPKQASPEFASAIEDLYVRMDNLVGRTMQQCSSHDNLLMVVSDHGFNSFRRGVDLNRWLEENDYLVVDKARRDEPHLAGVDWSRTRAFAVGLTGIFINQVDRFEHGVVASGEQAKQLRDEIQQRLAALIDPADGSHAVKRVYQAVRAYRGPYKEQAPDLIVGYAPGYRVSWEAAIGRTTQQVFHDNTKAWSGDHCVDPSVVPGILFCSHKIEEQQPRLLDIAPTVLDMFGVPKPDYMDGQPLTIGESGSPSDAGGAADRQLEPQVA